MSPTALRRAADAALRLLDRTPTHTVVIVALSAIGLAAVMAALLGALGYDAVALLASAAVAVVFSIVSAEGFARLFRSRAHAPSSAITGLLLFLILPPQSSPYGLSVIALAAVIAGASKFVLAWRGRHVFNPAAVAAVIITLTQLTAATWWVATPPLLAVVLLTGLAVVARLRRFALVGVFAAIALAIAIARLMSFGAGLGDAAWTALASFPVVFLAAFMLTEPLTLPPRRWQRLLVAAVVAVLFAVPFQLGPVYSSPELALVVGNLVAFAFGQRRGIRLRFEGSTRVSPTAWEFAFSPTTPLRWSAGQYLELTLPHERPDARGSRRSFTIASAPADTIVIGTRIAEPVSSFKRALTALPPGTRLHAQHIAGDFVLPADARVPLLLVASGIGVTPFLAQLPALAGRDVVLVYAAGSGDELAWAPRIAAAGVRVVTVTPEPPLALPDGWISVTGRLSAALIAQSVPDLARRTALVAGRPEVARRLRRELRDAGVRRVRTDQFAGV